MIGKREWAIVRIPYSEDAFRLRPQMLINGEWVTVDDVIVDTSFCPEDSDGLTGATMTVKVGRHAIYYGLDFEIRMLDKSGAVSEVFYGRPDKGEL